MLSHFSILSAKSRSLLGLLQHVAGIVEDAACYVGQGGSCRRASGGKGLVLEGRETQERRAGCRS